MKPYLVTAILKASFTLKLFDKKATPRILKWACSMESKTHL